MEQLSSIDEITPATAGWTCKIQVVDKGRLRESDKNVKFQTLILQDEQETQIRGVLFGDHIRYYKEKLELFKTYLVSDAKVKESPTSYGTPLHRFYWQFDRETIVEPVNSSTEEHGEAPLPPPTKLNLTPFEQIPLIGPNSNEPFDIMGVIVCCDPPKTAGRRSNKCQEFNVADIQNNRFVLTLWEEFAQIDGTELMKKLKEAKHTKQLPVIVARSVVTCSHRGLSLQTKFNTTIQINPPYPPAVDLLNWAKRSYDMLSGYSGYTVGAIGVSYDSVSAAPSNQTIISIADIQKETTTQTFHVEATMSLANESQRFYMLECSDCKQLSRFPRKRSFHCTNCNRQTSLVPRCLFQVNLSDGSGSATAVLSGDLGERLLSMTAEDIYETRFVKNEQLSLIDIQEQLKDRLFRVQLRKSVWKNSENVFGKLWVLSYTEKEQIFSPIAAEGNKKKKGVVTAEMQEAVGGSGSSTKMLKLAPPTPSKKV